MVHVRCHDEGLGTFCSAHVILKDFFDLRSRQCMWLEGDAREHCFDAHDFIAQVCMTM